MLLGSECLRVGSSDWLELGRDGLAMWRRLVRSLCLGSGELLSLTSSTWKVDWVSSSSGSVAGGIVGEDSLMPSSWAVRDAGVGMTEWRLGNCVVGGSSDMMPCISSVEACSRYHSRATARLGLGSVTLGCLIDECSEALRT